MTASQEPQSSTEAPEIFVENLSYTFPSTSSPTTSATTGLSNINLSLPPRSRTLLIGANGSGKTTLLRLLAGKRLPPQRSKIEISGLDPFSACCLPETTKNSEYQEGATTYLGLEWVLSPHTRTDISVSTLLSSVGGDAYPSRRDELISVLDVDVDWRMHTLSDGERRRVQLVMGLVRPWRVLLLDEVTVDLDVLSRARFLTWLKRETETRERPCSIVYATHVLDNLVGWPTHLVHMHLGGVREWGPIGRLMDVENEEIKGDEVAASDKSTGNSRLSELVLRWLRKDLCDRGPRGRAGRGAEGLTYAIEGIGGYGYEGASKR